MLLPEWEHRFTVEAENSTNAHRPLGRGHDLAAMLSHVHTRLVTIHYTLQFERRVYQIARADIRGGLRGARVRVEKRLDRTLAVKFRDRYLTVNPCPVGTRPPPTSSARETKPPLRLPAPSRPAHRWMEGFSLQDGPPLWKVLKAERGEQEPKEESW